MKIYYDGYNTQAAGNWDMQTTRYIPLGGGSRSRLPVASPGNRRYYGFVGIDEKLTETISTICHLYQRIGGQTVAAPGAENYISRILEQSKKWIAPNPIAIAA